MGLRDKYNDAIQTAKSIGMQGQAEERDGKLYFKGTTKSQEEANKIWDAIKTVPDWRTDIVADIQAIGGGAVGSAAGAGETGGKTYTVKAGDTLSQIAMDQLGSASAFTKIFEANRDQLESPDRIKPGQVLKIPQTTH